VRSAYVVPTPEASLTAIAGRALQGLGCGNCPSKGLGCASCRQMLQQQGAPVNMGYYIRGVPAPGSLLSGYVLPPTLSGLGAGSGPGRFNRAVSRGIYTLPFEPQPFGGSRGLGQLSVDPTLLIAGIGVLALGMFLLGGKHMPKISKRRATRLRRKISRYQSRLREIEA